MDAADHIPSSFAQISDGPSDDGFANVESKLKALEEKMKADAAKFEAEAKAPSSFVEVGASKVDPKVADLQRKVDEGMEALKAFKDKMQGEAKSSFVQLRQEPGLGTSGESSFEHAKERLQDLALQLDKQADEDTKAQQEEATRFSDMSSISSSFVQAHEKTKHPMPKSDAALQRLKNLEKNIVEHTEREEQEVANNKNAHTDDSSDWAADPTSLAEIRQPHVAHLLSSLKLDCLKTHCAHPLASRGRVCCLSGAECARICFGAGVAATQVGGRLFLVPSLHASHKRH